MAPVALPRVASGGHFRQISRSISASLPSLEARSAESTASSLASLFTVIGRHASSITARTSSSLAHASHLFSRHAPAELSIVKRQNAILAIPTTYDGLNAGPKPGTVVGITLGAVGGFLLALYILYTATRLSGRFGGTTVIEEEVIRRRSRSGSRRRSRSRSETIEIRSEHRSPVRRERRRRETETIVVEERVSRPPSPVEDDIVEVIEEHSPERRPSRKESKRTSGFRTVDPAEFGGGGRPMRKVSKR